MKGASWAFVAVAAAAAAAALAVWAAGFALFALLAPLYGDAAAAGIVAGVAAVIVALAAWRFAATARREATAVKAEVVGEVAEKVATPLVALAPLGLIAGAFRERPMMALGLTALAGVLVVRQPQLVREIAGAFSDRR